MQPADLLPGDISARLGAAWIPASDIRDFISETLDVPKSLVTVNHSGAIATWTLTLDSSVKSAVSNTTTWGTAATKATELIEDALNGRTPTMYDQIDKDTRVINPQETLAAREAQQKLKEKFSEWVWKDEERAHRLARYYNDTFNNLRLRTYRRLAPDLSRHEPHDAARRTTSTSTRRTPSGACCKNDNTLLAHTSSARARPM